MPAREHFRSSLHRMVSSHSDGAMLASIQVDTLRYNVWNTSNEHARSTVADLGRRNSVRFSLAGDIRALEEMGVRRTHDIVERLR